ncbi:hypothetical protein SRB5_64180 [Streptomyces sp. RB5]|uniref:Lipoprotein n=1 Tax=Streptomyces smaragdinus TaxID=2585196 RepID=A0A7K0CS19_9ACTN|nr:hypothetical protein [Streptomyces smaragdinus]MQY16220.1 hypothetical protein [Streptomyces smaragdinus]
MKIQRYTWPVVLGTAIAVAGLAGCNDSDKDKADGAGKTTASQPAEKKADTDPFAKDTALEVAKKATKATKGASSLTMDLDLTSDGEHITGTISLDKDTRCAGKLTLGGQGGMEIRRTTDAVYILPDDAFLKTQTKDQPADQAAATIALMKGRWLKTSVNSADAKQMAKMCDLDELLAELDDPDESDNLKKAGYTDFNGSRVFELTSKEDDGGTGTVYIQAEGEPYILNFEKKGGKEPGKVVMSDFNKPVDVQAPPADQILDPAALGG